MSEGKTPLMLLPGLLCDGALWRSQVEGLSDIAEPRVADLSRDDTMTGMANAVLEGAPERFALAGLSMGGYVAQEIMRLAPQRITRLALLDTSCRADTPEQRNRRLDFIAMTRHGKFKGVTKRLLPLLIHPDRIGDEELTDTIMKMAEHIGKEGYIRQQNAIMGRPDSTWDLGRIQCETLVLCGRQDALTPLESHREMAADIPHSTLSVIEDCGHLSTLERPEAVNAALRDWLSRE